MGKELDYLERKSQNQKREKKKKGIQDRNVCLEVVEMPRSQVSPLLSCRICSLPSSLPNGLPLCLVHSDLDIKSSPTSPCQKISSSFKNHTLFAHETFIINFPQQEVSFLFILTPTMLMTLAFWALSTN